ncbi:MAG: hypothetical protein HYV68_01920 [Candidatus Taylorbacteria bacterium]|nr:hypothetical protein [Candidatus Taylorbacteria bacterium]
MKKPEPKVPDKSSIDLVINELEGLIQQRKSKKRQARRDTLLRELDELCRSAPNQNCQP